MPLAGHRLRDLLGAGKARAKNLTLVKCFRRLLDLLVSHLREHNDLQPLLQELVVHADANAVSFVGLAALTLVSAVALYEYVRLLLIAQTLLDLSHAQVDGLAHDTILLGVLV